MKYLIYQSSPLLFSYMSVLLDKAITLSKEGYEVYFVTCGGCMNTCFRNMDSSKSFCSICKLANRKALKLLPKSVNIIDLHNYWEKNNLIHAFSYSNNEQLKKIKYHDVNIGFSVLSSYISVTRNAYPLINKSSKLYFDNVINQTCILTDCIQSLYDDIKPDCVCVFNGRLFEIKPALDLALLNKINVSVYEVERENDGALSFVEFKNCSPLSIDGNWDFCLKLWDQTDISLDKKIAIGESFFKNRRNGLPSGDVVYIGSQEKGLLPSGWDDSKINISIFNSSEDEFSSIGDEFESKAIFKSQIEGIKYILEQMRNDKKYHFYLRIHPNLTNIKYKYHTELLKLSEIFSNITVIPGDEKVSSYEILDRSDKVIVFGSTMGVEAAFWGKPVILLAGSFYYYANLCYSVNDKSEIRNLLCSKLSSKNNINSIKYGFYIMYNKKTTKFKFISYDWYIFKFFGKNIMCHKYLKLLGSSRLYALYLSILHRIYKEFQSSTTDIPTKEV